MHEICSPPARYRAIGKKRFRRNLRCYTFISMVAIATPSRAEILDISYRLPEERRERLEGDVPKTPSNFVLTPNSEIEAGPTPISAAAGPSDGDEVLKAAPISSLAVAQPSAATERRQVEWRDVKNLEIAYQVLNVVDAIETQFCISKKRCVEGNPLLGKHPSTGRLIGVKLGTGLIHYGVARWLTKSHPNLAKPFEYITITLQGGVVLWNLKHCF